MGQTRIQRGKANVTSHNINSCTPLGPFSTTERANPKLKHPAFNRENQTTPGGRCALKARPDMPPQFQTEKKPVTPPEPMALGKGKVRPSGVWFGLPCLDTHVRRFLGEPLLKDHWK